MHVYCPFKKQNKGLPMAPESRYHCNVNQYKTVNLMAKQGDLHTNWAIIVLEFVKIRPKYLFDCYPIACMA